MGRVTPDNPQAFPSLDALHPDGRSGYETDCQPGMTLRDWFAGKALAGMAQSLADGGWMRRDHDQPDARYAAEMAYVMADAMLAERQQ